MQRENENKSYVDKFEHLDDMIFQGNTVITINLHRESLNRTTSKQRKLSRNCSHTHTHTHTHTQQPKTKPGKQFHRRILPNFQSPDGLKVTQIVLEHRKLELPNSFYKTSITLIPELDKDNKNKYKYSCKYLNILYQQ